MVCSAGVVVRICGAWRAICVLWGVVNMCVFGLDSFVGGIRLCFLVHGVVRCSACCAVWFEGCGSWGHRIGWAWCAWSAQQCGVDGVSDGV